MRSAANWQLREQVKNLLTDRTTAAIFRPPLPVDAAFDRPESFVGSYGEASDPIVVSTVDDHLFRDNNEIYPIAGGRYYIPASGSVMRFRRTSAGTVDALVTVAPWDGAERVALKLPGGQ